MALKIVTGASVSANYHVHIARGEHQGGHSVTTGLANEKTIYIPIWEQTMRIHVAGNYQTGSASSNLAFDVAPEGANASAFANLFSTSASPFTTAIPLQVDHVLRVRHRWASGSAAMAANASLDIWIG